MSGDTGPRVLVVIRESPVRERTAALLESIALQKPAGVAQVVVISPRHPAVDSRFPFQGIECVPAEPDWMAQVRSLAAGSGCRWLVLPSAVDRYLPGAFEAVVELDVRDGQTVVGPCQVVREGQVVRVGPDPFRFDYFALLSGFNYIAPGGTFIDIRRWLEEGGFDPRFPGAPIYEYLLRTGAAGGVACCAAPLLETEADPFPGVPAAWAPLYAGETLSITLKYNRFFVTPGAALGLAAVLADCAEPYRHMGVHDEEFLRRLAGAGPTLKGRYLEQLGAPAVPRQAVSPPPTRALRSRIRAIMPAPIWNALRRSKRAWKALRDPVC